MGGAHDTQDDLTIDVAGSLKVCVDFAVRSRMPLTFGGVRLRVGLRCVQQNGGRRAERAKQRRFCIMLRESRQGK